jgi:hypothetical protein
MPFHWPLSNESTIRCTRNRLVELISERLLNHPRRKALDHPFECHPAGAFEKDYRRR